MAYFGIEPFGEGIANWRAGIIASTIANVYRPKGRRPFVPSDFMPAEPKEKLKPQNVEQMRKTMMGLTRRKKQTGKERAI